MMQSKKEGVHKNCIKFKMTQMLDKSKFENKSSAAELKYVDQMLT